MSAFIVSKPTLDVLVRGLLRYRLITRASADLVGQALWRENYRSLHYRYEDVIPADIDYTYTPRVEGEPPLDVAKLSDVISCFDYQACESPDWVNTPSRRLLDKLRRYVPVRGDDEDPEVWNLDSISECHRQRTTVELPAHYPGQDVPIPEGTTVTATFTPSDDFLAIVHATDEPEQ